MAVFENKPQNENPFNDSLLLSCVFQQYRIVDGHAEYIIKVQRGLSKANTWTIFKRYREFEALDKELQAASYDIYLPGKKLLGNLSSQFILQRQELLQTYMNRILSNLVLASSIYVKRFLDPDNYNPTFQDTAFQYASMAVRGKPSFHDMKPLPNVGWRYNKQYCKIKKYDSRREFVVTWISEYGNHKCLNDKELQSTFKVLTELSHPYIFSIIIGNYSPTGTLIIRPDCTEGSLRELIYERSRFDSFIQKCRYRRERLIMPVDAVSTISVQILHALAFLHHKKIPYGNLHSGNVFIEDNVAKISDVENSIFDLASWYKPYIIENRRIRAIQEVDVYCFGHVLYEMAFGERLQSFHCDVVPSDCYENLRPVLELLLTSSMETKLPSVSEILSFEAFEPCSSNVVFEERPHIKMSSHSRELFQRCQKAIESRIKNEQNELRRFRKITLLQEQVESEEKFEYVNRKEKRKMRKTSSQLSLKGSISEQCENQSNSSTTTLNTDSSPSTSDRFEKTPKTRSGQEDAAQVCGSVCDETNATPNHDSFEPDGRIANKSEFPVTDNRSQFLQSIVNFNKHNLKKISSTA